MGNPGPSGGGVVLCDDLGCIIWVSSYLFGTLTSFKVELRALLEGLKVCKQLGMTGGDLEINLKIIIDILWGSCFWPWRHWSALYETH